MRIMDPRLTLEGMKRGLRDILEIKFTPKQIETSSFSISNVDLSLEVDMNTLRDIAYNGNEIIQTIEIIKDETAIEEEIE